MTTGYDGFWAPGDYITAEKLRATMLQEGLIADRPLSALENVWFFATDTLEMFRYHNGVWRRIFQISSAAPSIPVVASPPIVQVTASNNMPSGGDSITLTAQAADPAGLELSYSWSASPNVGVFGSVNTTGSTTWTAPAAGQNATIIILKLTVSNSAGISTSDSVTITIPGTGGNNNQAPVISSTTVSSPTVAGNGSVTVNCVATDANNDPLTYQWSASPNVGSFPNGSTSASVTYQAPLATAVNQVIVLSCVVSDSFTTATGEVSVAVEANPPPVVNSVAGNPRSVAGGGVVSVSCVASDPDGHALTYQWSASPNVGAFANAASATTTWTAPASEVSIQNVTLSCTVSDGLSNVVSDGLAIMVQATAANVPPVITSVTANDTTPDGGQVVTVACVATDADAGDTLSYTWSASPNVGTFTGTGASVAWIAPPAKSSLQLVILRCTVSDGSASVSKDTAVTVNQLQTRTKTFTFPASSFTNDGAKAVDWRLTSNRPSLGNTFSADPSDTVYFGEVNIVKWPDGQVYFRFEDSVALPSNGIRLSSYFEDEGTLRFTLSDNTSFTVNISGGVPAGLAPEYRIEDTTIESQIATFVDRAKALTNKTLTVRLSGPGL